MNDAKKDLALIDGKPLLAVFRDRLFGPLGMKNTALPPGTSNAIPDPYAHGAPADARYPEDLRAAARAGTLKPNDDTWQNPLAYFAAGGVISTADDGEDTGRDLCGVTAAAGQVISYSAMRRTARVRVLSGRLRPSRIVK
ncbi:serine hydrolase [Taklimakanibacter deserti]|uniref:serine hydrolase n=1 Tax=Taklimakanibacter deserti TaxID=2267839 RepID=UPI000E65E082